MLLPQSVRAATAEHHRLGAYKQQTFLFFRTVLETKRRRSRHGHIQYLVKAGSLGQGLAVFLLCPHMEEDMRELSGVSLRRALIPLMRVRPPDVITPGGPRL